MEDKKDVKEALENLERYVTFSNKWHTGSDEIDPQDIETVLKAYKQNFELLKIYRSLAALHKEEAANAHE